ncbi:hypothetical protein [Candidatus Thiodiazotropha sp. LNASS1]|uniref:hypothetical protein n=1 Tax=Candidatus Thiodiazotropha sp. LNASS1 TaxID=3096260 RepID=UPI00346CE83D
MTQLVQNLNLALELSQEIVRLAGEKRWSDMDELDRQRMQILESIFADPEMRTGHGDFEDQLEQIVALNNQAMAICTEAREGVIQDGKRLKLGKEAVNAYLKQSYD